MTSRGLPSQSAAAQPAALPASVKACPTRMLLGPTAGRRVSWRSRGASTTAPIRHVFVFIGADPATGWLADCGVELGRSGFVVTGAGESPLASSVPGVFAVGDV